MKPPTIEVPNFITHYSRGKPFQSLSSLGQSNWAEVITTLNETNAWGLSRFRDPDYLPTRIQTEKIIRRKFQEMGGKPILEHPIYFFLGRNLRFEQHSLNRAYIFSLKDIPTDLISFTYGDSLLAFDQKNRSLSGKKYQNSLCENIFRFENIEDLFSHSDFPKVEPLHIEVQLWTQPFREWTSNFDRSIL